jgi:hypothetical protein
MWKLYLNYEDELDNKTIFDPMSEIFKEIQYPNPKAPTGGGAGIAIPVGFNKTIITKAAVIESARLSSIYSLDRRFVVVGAGPQSEPLVRSETLAQGWMQELAPAPAPEAQPTTKAQPDAPSPA